uniref:choline-phosphate cytidylyltransferase n=1 Tax=Arion vulgaris TaxID=1028688 RepID=A0A0B6ZKH5_9EUPU
MATAGENNTFAPSRKRMHVSAKSMTDISGDNEVAEIMQSTIPKISIPQTSNIRPAPFSHEQEALDTKAQIDYTNKISMEDAKAGRAPRAVRIYADGIYDMFHTGHARQLMQAKMAFPETYLIVGVCSDELTLRNKGRTVMNDTERYEAVRHCRYVDEVLTDAPWTLDMAFLEKHKIDFVAHDELPYTTGSDDDVYKFVKERGMFLATERTEGVSTTDVIARIIKDYDLYIRRNLARGYSHKELNVSYMKAKRLKLKDNYERFENKLKDKGKDLMDKWKGQIGKGNEMLHRWEEKSKEFIGNFVEMFGKEGKLGQWLQENTLRLGRAMSPTSSSLPDSPSSPSTSDPGASPPTKRGRYTPPMVEMVEQDIDSDDDDDDEFYE